MSKCKQCGTEHNRVSRLQHNRPSEYCCRPCYMKSDKVKAYQKDYQKKYREEFKDKYENL